MSRRTSLLLAAVAAVVLVAAYWMLALKPKRQEAAKLQRAVAAKQSELAQQQSLLATYRKARTEYRANYATLVRLGKAVPADDDTRSLVVQLDMAAKRSGVDFRTISVGGGSSTTTTDTSTTGAAQASTPPPGAVTVGTAGFSAMPFTFSFRGTFGNLSSFFARLDRFVDLSNHRMNVTGRLLRVESITLKPDQSGFPRIRADVGASSYLLPATQGLTASGTTSGPSATSTQPSSSSGGGTAATTTATATGATP